MYGARRLEQPQHSITKTLSKTARLECVVSGVTIYAMSIYWYQERPGHPLKHLLFISADDTVNLEPGITVGKFEVDRIPETSTSTLTIHNVQKEDSATYYCAFWEVHSSRQLESSQSINDLWFFIHYYEWGNHSHHHCAFYSFLGNFSVVILHTVSKFCIFWTKRLYMRMNPCSASSLSDIIFLSKYFSRSPMFIHLGQSSHSL